MTRPVGADPRLHQMQQIDVSPRGQQPSAPSAGAQVAQKTLSKSTPVDDAIAERLVLCSAKRLVLCSAMRRSMRRTAKTPSAADGQASMMKNVKHVTYIFTMPSGPK